MPGLAPELHAYQAAALEWMLQREQRRDSLPAAEALLGGDRVLRINGNRVDDVKGAMGLLAAAGTEVRLTDTRGFVREPSNRPGYTEPWREVCTGAFEVVPPDLREMRGRRGHHALFLAVLALGAAYRFRGLALE